MSKDPRFLTGLHCALCREPLAFYVVGVDIDEYRVMVTGKTDHVCPKP